VHIRRAEVSRGSGRSSRKRVPREVEIIHPPARNFRSGGHIFNKQLVAAAHRRGVALTAHEVPAGEAGEWMREDVPRLRLWDSLFLETFATREFAHAGEHGLLLHYLPSEDPTRDRSERLRLQRVEARAIEGASRVIATSRAHKASVESAHPATPAFVCEPGVSDAFLAPSNAEPRPPDGVLRVLTVANFTPAKGLMEVLFALSRLVHIEWRWHVVGDEARDAVYTTRFDAAVRQLGLARRVVRHGALGQQAIAKLMDEAELFVYASRFEAYGMVLAEAAAMRLPAVTTEVGAAASLYSHGHTGFVCAVEDGAAFAFHLERLMTDAALRSRFRENLRDSRARTWDDALDDFIAAVVPFA
jgi:glycosyltransferase involved in cell wall biosynthesis